MHIQSILFSILFDNLNQFPIIYKIPLQAESVTLSFPLTELWPEQLLCLFPLIIVLQSSSPPSTPLTVHPDHGTLFLALHLESKVQGDSQHWCGKEQSFMACSLDCLCLLCPLGNITSYTHFLDFTLAHLGPTWQLPSDLLIPTKRNSQVK